MHRLGWLKPGLGVKRWLVIAFLGAAIIALGVLSGVRALAAGAQLPDPLVQVAEALYLRELEPAVRAVVASLVGSALVGIGLVGLARAAILPYRTDRPGVSLLELLERRRRLARGPRVVVLGGGTGLATALRGLKLETSHVTAIVSMGDDGGSSGVLREQLGIPPVGDLRNCLVALSDAESTAAELLRFRLPAEPGAARGHAIGNLLLAAAIHQEGGDLERGVARVHRILNVRGEVIPGTPIALELIGTTRHGDTVRGQAQLARTRDIERMQISPDQARATPSALMAIRQADLIVLGPGSLYTSVIPHLLVPELLAALQARQAPLVWVANVDEQEGETEGMDLDAHLAALEAHGASGLIDGILATSLRSRRVGDSVGVPITPTLRLLVDAQGNKRPRLYVRDVASRRTPHLHESSLLARALLDLPLREPRTTQ
ncbi:MAG: YvcK family protein [bacterium]|nr:YvcK family protein [Candidatus Aquidulcis sp.]